MTKCRSEPKLALFGRIPPRTPGRSDAEVPNDAALGPALYTRISHVYFYSDKDADAAFGLLDIEISLQRRSNGEIWLEAYCIGDGFQSGRGSGADHPLQFELRSGDKCLARAEWHYPSVLCGHFDPMMFATRVDLTHAEFESADRIYLPETIAEAESCTGAPVAFGGPAGH
jgi:hypothetical protein